MSLTFLGSLIKRDLNFTFLQGDAILTWAMEAIWNAEAMKDYAVGDE